MEVQAINMEKKRLMNHWNSSLAGMKQRDEAYIAAQELLRYLKTVPGEISNNLDRRDSQRAVHLLSGLFLCVQGMSEQVCGSKARNNVKGREVQFFVTILFTQNTTLP